MSVDLGREGRGGEGRGGERKGKGREGGVRNATTHKTLSHTFTSLVPRPSSVCVNKTNKKNRSSLFARGEKPENEPKKGLERDGLGMCLRKAWC